MYTDPGSSIYTKTDAYFFQTCLAKSITIWPFFQPWFKLCLFLNFKPFGVEICCPTVVCFGRRHAAHTNRKPMQQHTTGHYLTWIVFLFKHGMWGISERSVYCLIGRSVWNEKLDDDESGFVKGKQRIEKPWLDLLDLRMRADARSSVVALALVRIQRRQIDA